MVVVVVKAVGDGCLVVQATEAQKIVRELISSHDLAHKAELSELRASG